jgi:hypothetical protein
MVVCFSDYAIVTAIQDNKATVRGRLVDDSATSATKAEIAPLMMHAVMDSF